MASEPNRFSIGPLKTRKEIRDSSRIFVAKLRFDKAEKKESRRRGERSTEEKREGCVTERNKEGRRKREKKEKKKRGMGATPLKYQGKFLGPASSVTPYFYSSSQFVPFLFRAAVSSVIFLTRFNFSYMSSSSLSLSLSPYYYQLVVFIYFSQLFEKFRIAKDRAISLSSYETSVPFDSPYFSCRARNVFFSFLFFFFFSFFFHGC